MNTNFQGKRVPKEDLPCECLSLIMLDSVVGVSKEHYPQTLLEECKYETKSKEMENLINDELDLNSSENETDNEGDSESDNDESNE